MARMYPQPMRPDTRSHTERKLYAAFQNQLPDDYVVFHCSDQDSGEKPTKAVALL